MRGKWQEIDHWSLVVHCSFIIFPLLLLWRPLFAGEAFYWGTPLLQFMPWQRMATQMWRSGHLPLWNPLVGCGAPLVANYQTAAFYPLNVLYLLLPAEVALTWTTALHLALAGWGMYAWGRSVGLDRFPAFVGALACEGSGFLVTRVALFPSMAFTFPWLVVWLWRAEILVQSLATPRQARGRWRDALWLGLALGLGLLAGHAQTAFYGGMLLAAYLLFRAWCLAPHASRITPHVLRPLALAALALVLGVSLAAVQLFPTAELMLQSQRSGGVDYDFAMTYSFWPWRLITFLMPDFFGNPGRGDYWGYATYWEDAGYVGLLALLLAIGAMFKRGGRGAQKSADGDVSLNRFWTAGALIALVLALGQNTPVFPLLFRHIPTFNLFQAPTRWLAIATVALSALAALGAQRWPAGRFRQRRGALTVVIGVALLVAGLAAPRLVPNERLATFGAATLRLGLSLAVVGVLTLVWRERVWWRAAVGCFIVLDLLLFGWPSVPTLDRALYHGATEAAGALEQASGMVRVYWPTDPAHHNREYDAENRVKFSYLRFDDFGPRDVDYWRGMREALLPNALGTNAAMLDSVASANNFDPLLVGRYVDLLGAVIESPGLLRAMGVTHVMSDEPWPRAEPIYGAGSVTLHRLPDALGRAWIVPAARQVPANEALAALADPAFDPAVEVLIEVEPAIHPLADSPIRSFADSQILSLHDTPNGVKIRAALDAAGYLVLADTWYPGWRATVDGAPVELLRANYAFRAVWLEAGEHTVEMVYRPTSVLVGGAVSLAAIVLLGVGLVLARREEPRG